MGLRVLIMNKFKFLKFIFVSFTIYVSAAFSVFAGGSLQAYEPRSWEGAYVGIHGGAAWGDVEWSFKTLQKDPKTNTFTTKFIKIFTDKPDGGLFGAHTGGLKQKGNFVYGVELSVSGGNVDSSSDCPDPAFTCTNELEWLGLLSGKAGYANDNWMAYVMGGLSLGQLTIGVSGPAVPGFALSDYDTQTLLGWHVGAGVDYRLNDKLSLGVEYIYADLGDDIFKLQGTPDTLVEYDTSIVRAKLSYKLN